MRTCQVCKTDVSELNAFCTTCGARMADQEQVQEVNQTSETLEPAIEEGISEDSKSPQDKDVKARLKVLQKKKADLEKSRQEVEAGIEERENFRSSLDAWSHANTSSFLWQTFSTMKTNLDQTQELLDKYESTISHLNIPDPGVMHSLRKTFHRRLLATFTSIPAAMALLLWIPTLIAKIVGHPGLVTFLTSLAFTPLTIYSYGIGAMIVITIVALIAYYRGWSTYQARVIKTLWELESVALNAAHVRAEQIRLKSIYPQLREWLEIMGHSLTNPWQVNKKWFATSTANIAQDSLPYSMHIAQTSEDEGPAMLGMQRYAAERFMVRGWRSRVFAEQVETIQEAMGLNKDRLNVDLLDSDIAYAPNGPRALVRANIADSKILEKVAQKQIVPLTLQIQKEAIANTKPQVHEVRSGQNDALGGSNIDLEGNNVPWDDFLGMSLGDSSRLASPFALHSLSDSGQVAGHQSRADSFFIVPQRLANKITSVKPTNLKTYTENANLPMDIVVRLDFTGPIPNENLMLLANSDTGSGSRASTSASQPSKDSGPRESGI
jgi:hypothetical protein